MNDYLNKPLTEVFPEFVKFPDLSNTFVGFFKNQNNLCKVKLIVPEYPLLNDIKVELFINSKAGPYNFENLHKQYKHVFQFILHLFRLIDHLFQDPKYATNNQLLPFSVINQTLEDCKSIIEDNPEFEVEMSKDFHQIKFVSKEYSHDIFIEFRLVPSATEYSVFAHSLPQLTCGAETAKYYETLLNKTTSTECSIKSLFQIFIRFDEQFYDYYHNLETLDDLCHVVDPPVSKVRTVNYNWRIIKMEPKVYLKVILDPTQINSSEIIIIGPPYLIKKYNEKIEEQFCNWDYESNIYRNLLVLFDLLSFPRQDATGQETACVICSNYRCDENNEIPLIWCDNDLCSAQYHSSCLERWYTCKNNKTLVQITSGKCLNCTKEISMNFKALSII